MATAGDILARVNEKLNDLAAVRWPEAEHIRAINDAESAMLEARPDLFDAHASVAAIAGSIQSVPADCYLLFDVIRNLSATNDVGRAITRIDRSVLDRQKPDWPTMPANAVTRHWMQDDRERTKFYVAPPQPATGTGKYYIRYAKRPTTITGSGDNLNAPAESINAIYNFCMHRALEKDEKFAGSPTAASYMQKWANFIGAKGVGEDQANAQRSANEGV